MAEIIQVAGACHVLVNTGAASALAGLGFTENGAEVEEEMLQMPIPGDQNGGNEGAPIDIQDFGRMGRVHLEMSKWDSSVAAYVKAKANPNGTSPPTAGTSPAPGTLLISNTWYFRLLLFPATLSGQVYNFLYAIPIRAYRINLGTKYARFVTDWDCFPPLGGGVYYNQVTS